MNSGTWRQRALRGGVTVCNISGRGSQCSSLSKEPNAVIINDTGQPFHFLIPVHAEQRALFNSRSALQNSLRPTVFLISDCNQARILRGKGLQSVGLEEQQKAALGALQTQIDVVQCAAMLHSAKCFIPHLDCAVKVLGLRTSFFPSRS